MNFSVCLNSFKRDVLSFLSNSYSVLIPVYYFIFPIALPFPCVNLDLSACFEKKSSIFSSVSPVAVVCFCTKLSGICTKQNIFCTKTGENSGMFFLDLPYFLFRLPDFFWAFPAFLSERVRFSRLPIRFLRVFSTLSVMILLFLFHQSVFFPYSFDKKSIFFRMNHPSGYASFLFSSGYFHIFSDAPADFSVLPRILFCIFSVRLQKIICCFFIRIIRFLRFFCFLGTFSKEKSAFFLFLSSGFQACLS